MPRKTKAQARDPKVDALQRQGCLYRHPEYVTDPLFAATDFFDARDLVQVKYEMLRRVRAQGEPITESAAAFGFSRPSFYQAQAAFELGGLAGLLPKKRGPRGSHKLSAEIMEYLLKLLSDEPALRAPELAERVLARFGCKVHPRSVERALARQKKKRD